MVRPSAFLPFIADFLRLHPLGRVYVATEDTGYARWIKTACARRWGAKRFFLPNITTRVGGKRGNFYVHNPLAVAHDVLLDIQMLARTDYFLHSASAVAEAVIYTNPGLHWRSTHLEYMHSCAGNQSSCGDDLSCCHDAPWRWNYERAGW